MTEKEKNYFNRKITIEIILMLHFAIITNSIIRLKNNIKK